MDPEAMWTSYVTATGALSIEMAMDSYIAEAFAEEIPEVATELALLVRDGPKRATASVLAEWEAEGEPIPQAGAHMVVLDGTGAAVCVIRTTVVEVRRFGDVDEAFAWEEGEGDRTLTWWRQAHIDYYAGSGTTITDDTMMVLEWFELVWPL